MERFRFVDDLTSDVMFEAYGKDLKEVFENAAFALFNVMFQVGRIKPERKIEVSITADDVEELMISWLQELISRSEIEGMFFCKAEIHEIDEKHIRASVYGEPADPSKGETLVKAVTYYGFSFEKTDDGYRARVSLDI